MACTIIVTGGASGIGLGMVRHFASQSRRHNIVVLDLDATNGEAVVQTLKDEFVNTTFSFYHCDISSWESQARAFADVHAKTGRIDIVMANAGISQEHKLIVNEDEPQKPDLRTLNVNLIGTIYTAKLAIHYLKKNELSTNSYIASEPFSTITSPEPTRGSIICTASNASLYPFPVAPIYGTAKHGVVGFVRSMARPLEKESIRINALAPSTVETNIAPSKELFKEMILTPMSTVMKGVDMLLYESSLAGQVAEIHGESVTLARPPPYVDEDTRYNVEHFWNLGYA